MIYNSPQMEWLTEYNHMEHSYVIGNVNLDGSSRTQMELLYTQLGYHLGLFTPYVRYELNASDHPDAYLNASPGYQAQGFLTTTRYYVAGVRYELSSASALKFEGTYIDSGSPVVLPEVAGTGVRNSDWTANFDWSFAF